MKRKRYLCWTCILNKVCKFATPTCTKCSLQEAYENYFNNLLKAYKKNE